LIAEHGAVSEAVAQAMTLPPVGGA